MGQMAHPRPASTLTGGESSKPAIKVHRLRNNAAVDRKNPGKDSFPGTEERPEMFEQENTRTWASSECDRTLSSLLDRLNAVIEHARSTAASLALFAVEAQLTTTLREVIPEAKFIAEDIRNWSAPISS